MHTQTHTLSLHDALPISEPFEADWGGEVKPEPEKRLLINTEEFKRYIDPGYINAYSLLHSKGLYEGQREQTSRSEEHTSELQSRGHLVCRLRLEIKCNTA